MELVKRVDVRVTRDFKLEITDNPDGNYCVYHTKITKKNYSHATAISFLIYDIKPEGFHTNSTIQGKTTIITLTYGKMSFSFKVITDEKGITGTFDGRTIYNWDGEPQLFFYSWDSDMNTLRFFDKIFYVFSKTFSKNIIFERFKRLFPDATNHLYHGGNSFEKPLYIASFGHNINVKDFAFEYSNEEFFLLGDYEESERYNRHIIHTLEYYENEKKKVDEDIEDLLAIKEMLANQQAIPKEQDEWELSEEYDLLHDRLDYEKTRINKELAVKEENKRMLPELKAMERDPELMKINTRGLLNMLQASRSPGFYYYGVPKFSVEQIKAELSHRPHVPNKAEAKVLRRLAAQGKIEMPREKRKINETRIKYK